MLLSHASGYHGWATIAAVVVWVVSCVALYEVLRAEAARLAAQIGRTKVFRRLTSNS
jgi:hypothetical protein